MKITIIYDNSVYIEGLQSDWGFSCLVEVETMPGILFDTGARGSILLSNMKKLNINPDNIDIVFISHPHFDHTGGLAAFLEVNSNVMVYVPSGFRGIRSVKKVVSVTESKKIGENVFSTGELNGIEQSLAVRTEKGVVLVTGCSHPPMKDIIEAASTYGKVYAIVGGLHATTEFELFKDFDYIAPAHCTQHKERIKSLYPEKYVTCGTGKEIYL